MRKQTLFIAAIFVLLALFNVQLASAQPGLLSYGQTMTGELNTAAPIGAFVFIGGVDDMVTAYALGLSPGLQPALTLLGPASGQLGFNATDLLTPMPNDARISLRLPEAGTYTILLNSVDGTPGSYALSLTATPNATMTTVSGDETITANLTSTTPEQVFTFQTAPERPNILTLQAYGMAFTAILRNAEGGIVSFTADVERFTLQLPADNTYELTLMASNPTGQVTVEISLSEADAPLSTSPPEPASEPCSVTPSNAAGAFLRGGPGEQFNVVDGLPGGGEMIVTGVNGTFYYGEYNDSGVWVDAQFVTVTGDCDNLPQVAEDGIIQSLPSLTASPPSPTPIPTNTASAAEASTVAAPTTAPAQGPTDTLTPLPTFTLIPTTPPTATTPATATLTNVPTATFTPSYTPTTPPVAQVAPADARFNNPLDIPLDSTASVLDFVSYPDGDTEDRVRWDIIGMNQNSGLSGGRARLVISATCFGENTGQIQFFTGGQTYACGATLVDREVTAGNKTGSVIITAVGGEGTYVQWVLTGTATRTN